MKTSKQNVVRLIPRNTQPATSPGTVAALRDLLDQAHRGEITGLVYAVVYPDRGGSVGLAGAAEQDRTRARGMVAELDDFVKDFYG